MSAQAGHSTMSDWSGSPPMRIFSIASGKHALPEPRHDEDVLGWGKIICAHAVDEFDRKPTFVQGDGTGRPTGDLVGFVGSLIDDG
tara:strand:- start:1459 stop:1716 length:258 start_codon:yes stop_codon:yes gene_type:complete